MQARLPPYRQGRAKIARQRLVGLGALGEGDGGSGGEVEEGDGFLQIEADASVRLGNSGKQFEPKRIRPTSVRNGVEVFVIF